MHLLQWFRELARARVYVGNGIARPIAWGEIDAWARVRGLTLTPWEVDTLKRLDNTYLEARA